MRNGKYKKNILKKQSAPGSGRMLEWVWCRSREPRGMVFLPPLIGGNLSQQIGYFRPLVAHGYDLVSFTYAGHGRSGGRFSLSAALGDTGMMLDRVMTLARQTGVPLFGAGCCFSAIPLLHGAIRRSEPFRKIVLINAVTRIDPLPVLGSFLVYYHKMTAKCRSLPGVSEALRSYLDLLFPGVVKSRHTFGVLNYRRLRPWRLLREAIGFSPLADQHLANTQVLSLYSRRDPVMDIISSSSAAQYQSQILSVCPRADFRQFDTDHFFSHAAVRHRVRDEVLSFFGNP